MSRRRMNAKSATDHAKELLLNPASQPSIVIAANPKAGARPIEAEIARLQSALIAAGFDEVRASNLSDLTADVAAITAAGKSPVVIPAGGDGTMAAAVNATSPAVPILPYPLGTENLLARHFGLAADPETVIRVLRVGRCITLDAGSAGGRLFLLMASCGFDADVVRRMNEVRRGHIDHFSYIKPIYDALMGYRFPTIRVSTIKQASGDSTDAAEEVTRGKWAFVINLPRYARGLQFVPEAQANDGLLDVCVFKRGSLLHGLVYLAGVLLGTHQSWPDCHVSAGTRIRIEADEPVPYQLDGDPGGFLPIEIDVLPQRVKLLVPP
jgi:diacylglycerol kinase family enzyme